MKSALSFGLRDYSVSTYAPSALIEEISRDLSPWSFVFTERLIVLLLRQPWALPSVFFPMDHPSQYRVVMCVWVTSDWWLVASDLNAIFEHRLIYTPRRFCFYAPHHHFSFLISHFSFKKGFQTEPKVAHPTG